MIEYLIARAGDHATNSVAGHCRLPVTPTRRHLQDLNALGVIDLAGEFPERWTASAWLRDNWWAVTDPAPGMIPR